EATSSSRRTSISTERPTRSRMLTAMPTTSHRSGAGVSGGASCGRGSASTAGNVSASRRRLEASARSAAMLLPPQRRLHPRVEPELHQGVREMGLHRRDLDEEPRGDLLVGHPLGDQREDVLLAPREGGGGGRRGRGGCLVRCVLRR